MSGAPTQWQDEGILPSDPLSYLKRPTAEQSPPTSPNLNPLRRRWRTDCRPAGNRRQLLPPRPAVAMAGLKRHHDGKIAGLYDLDKTLGRGHFAVVKLARHVFTGEKVRWLMSVRASAVL